jgi:16S rRNA (uracil1498-N3)-methyltransferase
MRKIRLFINEKKLHQGLQIKVAEGDFDYLSKVMRQKTGDQVAIFNGNDGEFLAEIVTLDKKSLSLEVKEKIGDLKNVPNFTLAFAPTKNVAIDFVAKKGVELGVASFQPIITARTIVDKINEKRFCANVKEGLEQCERNDFPQICEIKKLDKFLSDKNSDEKIFILCDESGEASKASDILQKISHTKKEIVILIGPEGGFSADEFTKMRSLKNLHSISLGPRILRADTAMICALTLVQEFLGDWK